MGAAHKRINTKTPAEGRWNQAQGTLFLLLLCFTVTAAVSLLLYVSLKLIHIKEHHVLIMYSQKDVDLTITCQGEDLHENYVPASFDEYLMNARMRHKTRSTKTKLKPQSDYEDESTDVILFFLQIRYKTLLRVTRLVLINFCCVDRHHQGHRQRRFDPGRGRLL